MARNHLHALADRPPIGPAHWLDHRPAHWPLLCLSDLSTQLFILGWVWIDEMSRVGYQARCISSFLQP